MARIIIVNDTDHPIDLKTYEEIRYEDIYRVAALWLTDTKTGNILFAQRSWGKHNDPGKWAAAVAGTLEEGESYKTNIVKETEEEIGLTDVVFTLGPRQFVDDGAHKFFCQWFFATVDKSQARFTLQEEEVEAISWLSNAELLADVQRNPDKYTPSIVQTLEILSLTKA